MLEDENFIRELGARCEKFKKEGLKFLKEDAKNDRKILLFQVAFAKFINDSTPDEAKEFIAKIPIIKDKFDFLQNNDRGNICACVLAFVEDTDRKTSVLKALFDAEMDYAALKEDDNLFLYSQHLATHHISTFSILDRHRCCKAYLKAILSSRNYDKFAEAVKDLHLGQLALRQPGIGRIINLGYILVGIEIALEYLRDHPLAEIELLKPFLDDLTKSESVPDNYYGEMLQRANQNREELQKLSDRIAAGVDTPNDREKFKARTKSIESYESLKRLVELLKKEYQKAPSLGNLAGNTIIGIVKDKKSIEELPVPIRIQNHLKGGYHDTFHPKKREVYSREQDKLAKLAKFTEPLNDNKGAQVVKSKRQSKQDIQTDSKSIVRRSRSL